ncbi:hypothetical protein X943_002368 [Babesia divergens]|uniref:RRM domain-containing protein n=1 Tax=Babesia divergens TaxID=32595 RepID=A0AAD9GD79_BABDI|nr:hypothetical protein X943_002368 [Babesia divergens]
MDEWRPISSVEELKGVYIEVKQDVSADETAPVSSDKEQRSKRTTVDIGDAQNQVEDSSTVAAALTPEEEARMRKREKKKQYLQRKKQKIASGQWVDSSKNLSVYISGLPDDITVDEVASVFKRAGVIKIDPMTTLPKIKLYTDETGKFKNDARVTFVNKESVDFAIRYLNNYHFREDCIIHVEEARYDPQKYKQRSPAPVTAEEMRKRYLAAKYEQERLQSWTDEIDDGTGRRIVICKPMFSAESAEEHEADSSFYSELREEVMAEITKFVPVDKVTPIPRHPQGVVCVKLKNSADAEIFISKFQGRVFDGRELQVYFFDGKTDLQSQTIPSKSTREAILKSAQSDAKGGDDITCDWIDNQSSDEEFEIRTE